MKFHIVRSNEKLEDILFLYNIDFDELKENNKYIKSWDKIPPGTKLRIPDITRNDDLEIMEMEPFIEDYYPSIESIEEEINFNKAYQEIKTKEETEIKNQIEEKEESLNENYGYRYQYYVYPHQYYYPIYPYYYPTSYK